MRFAAMIGLPVLIGCAVTATPKASRVQIPPETPAECSRICGEMGLQMTAVVVAASQVGCVCEKTAGAPRTSAGGVAGVTTAVLAALAASSATSQMILMTPPPQP